MPQLEAELTLIAQAPAGRQPRLSLGQQQSGATPTAKALAKTQEPVARQSFRGQLAFNPLHVSATQSKPESDSEEEQWQRLKAEAMKPSTAGARKLSAVAPPRATTQPLAQDRRLSLTKGAASSARAKPSDVHESDSDEEQWQRMKKMVKEGPKVFPVRAGPAAPSGRLSIRASPGAVPINAVQSTLSCHVAACYSVCCTLACRLAYHAAIVLVCTSAQLAPTQIFVLGTLSWSVCWGHDGQCADFLSAMVTLVTQSKSHLLVPSYDIPTERDPAREVEGIIV